MDSAAETRRRLRVLLPLAVFVVVIDSTIMNVSIGALVDDLDTEIAGVQSAIALYALVMASFLLTGAKLGDILGRRRAFSLGLGLYGVGSAGTALSQNLTMLILFWSVIEGLGAAVLFPTVQALVRTHFEGGDRMKLYALIGSVVGAGAAVGPLIGGFFTTLLTWRLAFAVEAAIVVVVLLQVRHIPVRTTPQPWRDFDAVGALLSVLGLGGVIVGILAGSRPGRTVAWPLVVGGVLLLVVLAWWISRRERVGRPPLVRSALARNGPFRSGVTQSLVQQFVVGGSMLITPIFVQMVLEYSALQTGLVVMPLSLSMFVTSNSVPRLRTRFSSRSLLQFGMVTMIAGIAWLTFIIGPDAGALSLVPGLLLMGIGLGFQMSQLNNLILSSVPVAQASEAGGVNTTAGQFGISLGTALAGTVMLFGLTSSFADLTAESTVLDGTERDAVAEALERDARIISNTELEALLDEAEADPELQEEILRINTEARPEALRLALLAPLFAGFVGLATSTRLPRNPAVDAPPLSGDTPDERIDP